MFSNKSIKEKHNFPKQFVFQTTDLCKREVKGDKDTSTKAKKQKSKSKTEKNWSSIERIAHGSHNERLKKLP